MRLGLLGSSALVLSLVACGGRNASPADTGPMDDGGTDATIPQNHCGDGTPDADEACDDGNTNNGDYCSADCSTVTGECGDGTRQNNETCDDGNGYCNEWCNGFDGRCGDGTLQSIEGCDPGFENTFGCKQCRVSAGTRCQGEPSVCAPSAVGWDKPLDELTRADAEAYCTWLITETFGNTSTMSCPGGIRLTRLEVSACADNFERFARTCVAPIHQVVQCSAGLSACAINTAGSANVRAVTCEREVCRRICEPSSWQCSGNTARRCNQYGNGYEDTDCGSGTCTTAFPNSNDPNEVCGLTICEADRWSCMGNTARLCAADRLSYAQVVDCDGASCVPGGDLATPQNEICDANECADGTHNCDPAATCTNIPGSFTCMCNAGYSGDGTTCTDIDECATRGCDQDPITDCENTIGSVICTCPVGYEGNGVGPQGCIDINECALGTHDCDPTERCVNRPASFECVCPPGHEAAEVGCVDIDECAGRPCGSASICTNTPGSYSCRCVSGYRDDGYGCVDIDECRESYNGPCTTSPWALCTNLYGGVRCTCPSGYQGTGIGINGCRRI